MRKSLKGQLRDLLPENLQVPVKFMLNQVFGQLEREVQLLRYLAKSGDSVIDIGGNRGVYAYAFWRLGFQVDVFEPNPLCAKIISAWGGKKNIRVHEVALSDQVGFSKLHIPVDVSGVEHDASASLEHNDFEQSHDIKVKLTTLDSFKYTDVSLIKIDVEGHETAVLQGAEQTILMSKPALLIEIEQRHNCRNISEIFDRIKDWDYQGYYLKDKKLYALHEFVLERDQVSSHMGVSNVIYINNFLFLHRVRISEGRYNALFQTWQKA